MHQRRWHQAVLEQLLRTVDILQHRIQQSGALNDGALDALPFLMRQHQRQHIQIPRPVVATRIGIDVVGNAVFAHLALHRLQTLAHLHITGRAQMIMQGAPVRTWLTIGTQHFVIEGLSRRIERSIGV